MGIKWFVLEVVLKYSIRALSDLDYVCTTPDRSENGGKK